MVILHEEKKRKPCNISDCCKKLSISDNQEWKNKLSYKPKLRTYKQCKENKCVENYIMMNLTCKERSMLAQLRMDVLPLHIETGRYKNIPADQRFCFVCKESIEDGMNFLFECPFYVNYRISLYEVISERDTESFKNMSKYKKLTYLIKYICHAFSKRQLYMYTNSLITVSLVSLLYMYLE